MDLPGLNVALCNALGITDTERVTAVTLRLRPQHFPTVTVVYHAPSAEGMQEVVDKYELTPDRAPTKRTA